LQATGGGKVTDTEVGDEEGAYEVEVTRADGSQVDVTSTSASTSSTSPTTARATNAATRTDRR
jgi:hypothetical protein